MTNDDGPATAPSATAASSSFSTPSNITTFYRQILSNFLFYSDASLENPCYGPSRTSWIGDTARSLALRAVTPFTDEITDNTTTQTGKTKKSSNKSNMKYTKVSATETVRTPPPHWSDFVCMACGTFLFPPKIPTTNITESNNSTMHSVGKQRDIKVQFSQTPLPYNIYIRPLKRGRTRRRRASRSKAKQLHSHALSLQRRGASNSSIQLRKDILVKEETQRIASSYCMGDGRAKNCLVMTCTFCGTKKKRKGVEVKKNPTSGEGTVAGRIEHDSGRKKRHHKQPECRGEREKVVSQIRDNSDFISFSPVGGFGKKPAKQQQDDSSQVNRRKRSQDDSGTFASPSLRGKKKKKPNAKKGDLMDFLSSLND